MSTDADIKKVQGLWQKIGFHWSRGKKLATAGLTPESVAGREAHELEAESGLDQEFLRDVLKELAIANEVTGTSAPTSATETPSSEPSSSASDSLDTRVPTPSGSSSSVPKKKSAAKKKKKAAKGKKSAKKVAKKGDDVRILTAAQKMKRALTVTDKFEREVFGDKTKVVGIASEMKQLIFQYVSTSLTALDQILGGGILRGRFTTIVGPEQTCKTLIAMLTVAFAQRGDPNCVCVWIDQENTFDPRWAELHGVDCSRLLVIGPEILEDQMDLLEKILWETAPAVVVYDSVGAAVSYQELETSKGVRKSSRDETMAMTARVLSKFFRRFTHQIAQTGPAMIFITHLYQKIGVMFGPDTEIKGGNALKAYCTAILATSRRKGDQDQKMEIKMPDGRVIKIFPAFELVVSVHKTKQSDTEGYKVAIPFIHGKGLSNIDSVLEMALGHGVIQKNVNWYGHPSFEAAGVDNHGWIHGKQSCLDFVKAHPDIFELILKDVGVLMAREDQVVEAVPEALPAGGEVPMP